MNQLMNIYEVNEPVLGVWGFEKKYALFFFLNMAFWRILGSLMFICFIKSLYEVKKRRVCQTTDPYQHTFNEPYEHL